MVAKGMFAVPGSRIFNFAMVAILLGGFAQNAAAATCQIAAFGASQTYGKGVQRGQDYPAQLHKLLRARGLDVRVENAGKNGNTTLAMLKRVARAVPVGTDVVIFQPGGNDRRKGVSKSERRSNIAAIRALLESQGVQVVMMKNKVFRKLRALPGTRGADGQHFTPHGYKLLARWFARKLPQSCGR